MLMGKQPDLIFPKQDRIRNFDVKALKLDVGQHISFQKLDFVFDEYKTFFRFILSTHEIVKTFLNELK